MVCHHGHNDMSSIIRTSLLFSRRSNVTIMEDLVAGRFNHVCGSVWLVCARDVFSGSRGPDGRIFFDGQNFLRCGIFYVGSHRISPNEYIYVGGIRKHKNMSPTYSNCIGTRLF